MWCRRRANTEGAESAARPTGGGTCPSAGSLDRRIRADGPQRTLPGVRRGPAARRTESGDGIAWHGAAALNRRPTPPQDPQCRMPPPPEDSHRRMPRTARIAGGDGIRSEQRPDGPASPSGRLSAVRWATPDRPPEPDENGDPHCGVRSGIVRVPVLAEPVVALIDRLWQCLTAFARLRGVTRATQIGRNARGNSAMT